MDGVVEHRGTARRRAERLDVGRVDPPVLDAWFDAKMEVLVTAVGFRTET